MQVGYGYEENTSLDNLIWNCRACNTRLGVVFKQLGMGRRTHQFNPSEGAKSLGAWMAAVLSMRGESNQMSVPELIQATPPARRSEFALEIWELRRAYGTDTCAGEVPF